MVCDLYPAEVGKEGEPALTGKGSGELLSLEQGEAEMERPGQNYRRAVIQVVRFCESE